VTTRGGQTANANDGWDAMGALEKEKIKISKKT
jgi:hypothetical protein